MIIDRRFAVVAITLVACRASPGAAGRVPPPPEPSSAPPATAFSSRVPAAADDQALFDDLLAHHYSAIFPDQNRNAGGPQFFAYIYERLATSHDSFRRYNSFYCGVSGSVIPPERRRKSDLVKVKNANGQCVTGHYHRCCWPCDCDVMKYARAERAEVRLPRDPSGEVQTHELLTIADPCQRCERSPCEAFPREVTAYQCRDGLTQNGIRVQDGQLTRGPGRLVFAVLFDAVPMTSADSGPSPHLMSQCSARIGSDPSALAEMGGMGNIFVDLARLASEESFTHSEADLCR